MRMTAQGPLPYLSSSSSPRKTTILLKHNSLSALYLRPPLPFVSHFAEKIEELRGTVLQAPTSQACCALPSMQSCRVDTHCLFSVQGRLPTYADPVFPTYLRILFRKSPFSPSINSFPLTAGSLSSICQQAHVSSIRMIFFKSHFTP